MQLSLQDLFQAIARARDEAELRQQILANVGEYFAATRWKLWFREDFPTQTAKMPAMMKLALSLDYNPVLRYLVERHTTVREQAILPPGAWQRICPRADHGHVLAGPIVSQGQLVGGIALTRHRNNPAFDADCAADLSAICLHFSTKLAALRSKPIALALNCDRLTPREAEIAELVARGLTNRKIGTVLWITENSVKQALKRMFRKLDVSSRAEMVAKLSVNSEIAPSNKGRLKARKQKDESSYGL